MKTLRLSFLSLFLVSLLALFLVVGQSHAAILVINSDIEYSGGTPPEGPTPWVTATFVDTGANTVRLTMSTGNLTGYEFVSKFNFNFDPAEDPTLLTFTHVSGTEADKIVTKINNVKAGGDGEYDISFVFPKKDDGSRFEAGEESVYDITYYSAIDVTSFWWMSSPKGGQGTYFSSAHIQGISDIECPIEELSCESGWIGASSFDVYLDGDFDGIPDAYDNCPDDPNSDQTDGDGDQYGAACDCDDSDGNVNPGVISDGCDGIDNDCDGAEDEDFIPSPTTCGIGVCEANGETFCEDGVEGDNCTPAPATEDPEITCDDGLDNDCDGLTDTADDECIQPDVGCHPRPGRAVEFMFVYLENGETHPFVTLYGITWQEAGSRCSICYPHGNVYGACDECAADLTEKGYCPSYF